MKTTTITISYTKKGNEFSIQQNINKGVNVRDLCTVLDSISDQIKVLTRKHLDNNAKGLSESEKVKISNKLKIEDLA